MAQHSTAKAIALSVRSARMPDLMVTCQNDGGCMQHMQAGAPEAVHMDALIVLHRPEAFIVSPTDTCRRFKIVVR